MKDQEADPYPVLPQTIRDIYDAAAPDVNRYLLDPTLENLDRILRFNDAIQALNEKDGRPLSLFQMPRSLFETIADDIGNIDKRLDDDPGNQKALERLREIVNNFEGMKVNSGYSHLWELPSDILRKLERLGKRNIKPKYDTGTDVGSQHSYHLSFSRCKTENGERILCYRPYHRKYLYDTTGFGKEITLGVRFIIEQKGKRNPIKLVSGAEVGRQCVRAYLSLPDSEKIDVTKFASKWSIEDLDDFDKIIGAASMPFKNKNPNSNKDYPDGYYLVKTKAGNIWLKNRQALRGMLGKDYADIKIAQFYEWARETPPWKVQPLNWRPQRLLIGPPEIEEDRRTRVLHHQSASFPLLKYTQADRPTRNKDKFIDEESIDKYIQDIVIEKLARLATK